MVPMRFGRFPVIIDTQYDPVARCLQSKAKPSGPAEQVRREAVTVRSQPRCVL